LQKPSTACFCDLHPCTLILPLDARFRRATEPAFHHAVRIRMQVDTARAVGSVPKEAPGTYLFPSPAEQINTF
jgi:hypothetical protein